MKQSANSALALNRSTVATLTPNVSKSSARMPTQTTSWSASNCCD